MYPPPKNYEKLYEKLWKIMNKYEKIFSLFWCPQKRSKSRQFCSKKGLGFASKCWRFSDSPKTNLSLKNQWKTTFSEPGATLKKHRKRSLKKHRKRSPNSDQNVPEIGPKSDQNLPQMLPQSGVRNDPRTESKTDPRTESKKIRKLYPKRRPKWSKMTPKRNPKQPRNLTRNDVQNDPKT